jgi:hypothetical protein
MLIKNCMVLLMLFAAGCTRAGACDGPQRLCAPDRANTSAGATRAGADPRARVPVLLEQGR